jgi:hypothetical protein
MNYYRGHIDISIKAESEDRAQWIMHEIGCLVNSEQPGTHSLTAEHIIARPSGVAFLREVPEAEDYEGEQVDCKWDDYPSTDTRLGEQG